MRGMGVLGMIPLLLEEKPSLITAFYPVEAQLRVHDTSTTSKGKIKNREHRFEGLQNAEKALQAVHTGENFGKAVIIVDPEGGEA